LNRVNDGPVLALNTGYYGVAFTVLAYQGIVVDVRLREIHEDLDEIPAIGELADLALIFDAGLSQRVVPNAADGQGAARHLIHLQVFNRS